jgi:hypothetical protein
MPGTTAFPAALDVANEVEANTPENEAGKEHDVLHNDLDARTRALQVKVGIDGSADTDSLDFKVAANTTAIAARIPSTEKGAANGVATLGSDSKIPTSQLPALAFTTVHVVANEAAQLALTAQEGDVAVRSDQNKSYVHNGGTAGTMADWTELLTPTDAVLSVAGKTGAVTLEAADITSGAFHAARIAGGTATAGYVPKSVGDGTVVWDEESGGGGGGSGIVETIVAGTGISVDDTDPANPIVSATGGGGGGDETLTWLGL